MSITWTAVKGLKLASPGIAGVSRERLEEMQAAGAEILECYRVLERGKINLVSEVLKGGGEFYEFDHFPKGDVIDYEADAQYYYHAHRGLPGEHGHFHVFVRAGGIPEGVEPVPYDGKETWPAGEEAVAHLGAISMDKYGFPIGMFATNRWVTDEGVYCAEDMKSIIDGFVIDHAYPSWPTNRWITAMTRLFRPEFEALLEHRDRVVAHWREKHPKRDVFEDRKLEITGHLTIYVKDRIAEVEQALDRAA